MWKRKGILVLVLALVLCISTFALEVPDPSGEGSISLTLKTEKGAVSGGKLSLYYVAQVLEEDGNYRFDYVDGFAGCQVDLSGDFQSKAEDIWDYGVAMGAGYTVYDIGSDGTMTAAGLPVGLYLVCQTQQQAADGYLPINPFLISIPTQNEDGTWNYQVDASPKAATVDTPTPSPGTPGSPSTPSKPSTPGTSIPDTGQLNWPVPVLAVAGLLIFALGWALRFVGRKPEDEA